MQGGNTEAEKVPVREDDGHGQSVQQGFTATVNVVQSLDVHHFLLQHLELQKEQIRGGKCVDKIDFLPLQNCS